MKKKYFYSLLFFIPLLLDRLTKFFVLRYVTEVCTINRFISLATIINRGISWGMFHSHSSLLFIVVTTVIMSVVVLFGIHTYKCAQQGACSGAEFIVLAGAVSNIVDRFLYGGVLDFILFSCGSWSFPYFNIADIAIVMGLGFMFMYSLKTDHA